MKKTIIKLFLFSCTVFLMFGDQIDKNKKRIQQIDSQVSKNNKKISANKGEISKAKKDENTTLSQVKVLDENISKLQNEYNIAEKRYRDILAKIGINTENINANIAEINRNTEIINVTKEDLYNKIRIWDKIRKKSEMSKNLGVSSTSVQNKKRHDLKILFNKQKDYILSVEDIKKGVENQKNKEELLKAKNQSEANEVNIAKNDLERKSKELNALKAEKNKLIAQLRTKQATLNTENKKIEKDNSQLAAEKKKLNAQIQAIIQRAIRERQLAIQKAEEEKRARAAASASAVQKSTGKARGGSSDLADRKTANQHSTAQTHESSKTVTNVQVPKSTGSLIRPISGSVVVNFGQEKVAGLKSNGVEIRGSAGQAVKAADSGIVIYAGALSNLGNVVIIDHGSLVTVYGNLAGISVSKGSSVSKGQTIGSLGYDQTTKQPNLYFEVRKGVNIVNPMGFI